MSGASVGRLSSAQQLSTKKSKPASEGTRMTRLSIFKAIIFGGVAGAWAVNVWAADVMMPIGAPAAAANAPNCVHQPLEFHHHEVPVDLVRHHGLWRDGHGGRLAESR